MKKYILIPVICAFFFVAFKASDYFEISKNLSIFADVYKEVNTTYVDEVKPYNTEKDLVNMLKEINPDIRILGADHEGTKFTGNELSSIKVIFNSRDHGYSTSELRRRVYHSEKKKISSSS